MNEEETLEDFKIRIQDGDLTEEEKEKLNNKKIIKHNEKNI
jgi:hypothetical protein